MTLSDLVQQRVITDIQEKYRTPERREKNEDLVLGILISGFCDYDGLRIFRVFAEALDDANFHTEAELITRLADMDNEHYEKLVRQFTDMAG